MSVLEKDKKCDEDDAAAADEKATKQPARTEQEIEQEVERAIQTVREEEAAATRQQKKVKNAKKRLSQLKKERERLRATEIPYTEFKELIQLGRKWIWQNLEISDPYEQYGECQTDDCWYNGNLSRLAGLELYRVEDLNAGLVWTICDVCYHNNRLSEISERWESEMEQTGANIDQYKVSVTTRGLDQARAKNTASKKQEEEERQTREQEEAESKKKEAADKKQAKKDWHNTFRAADAAERTDMLQYGVPSSPSDDEEGE